MRSQFKSVFLSLCMLWSAAAYATDLRLPTALQNAPPSSSTDWTGFHIGLIGGHAWGDLTTTNNSMTTGGALLGITNTAFVPPATFTGPDAKYSTSGNLLGLEIGYDKQIGSGLIGIETDLMWGAVTSQSNYSGSDAGPQYASKTTIDVLGSTRVRVGWVYDRVLLYGTGGVAYLHNVSELGIQGGTPEVPLGPSHQASQEAWHVGYAAGGGVEYSLAPGWSTKVEYLYTDFGKRDYDIGYGAAGSVHSEGKAALNLVRAGLNKRF
ncbi:MAG: porin family protein [Bradyrhizobiaceae bacterium]|nr:MAG: porin family protein [Bradyrhizobiaceae bacterium]